ncbi:MAG: hypothetical protein ND807_06145 [Vicinamibacterales bacterium]|nr:hypothetical protein [Vicinamibacterales bacterium]
MAEQSQLDVLEGRVEELSRHWDRLFADIGRLDTKIDALGVTQSARIAELERKFDGRFEGIDRRFDTLEHKFDSRFGGIDGRFEGIDRRFEQMDRRFDGIDRRLDGIDGRFDGIDHQFVELRAELSKQFRWTFSTMLALLGMMLTVSAGIATALLR